MILVEEILSTYIGKIGFIIAINKFNCFISNNNIC